LVIALTANWVDSTSKVITVKPAKVINARLVDASDLKPKPKAAPKPAAKPRTVPKPTPSVPKPTPKPAPKPKPVSLRPSRRPSLTPAKVEAKPEPAKPVPAVAEPEPPRMSQEELAAHGRTWPGGGGGESARCRRHLIEMAASYAALIQQTVILLEPPGARNGMGISPVDPHGRGGERHCAAEQR
jgi:outer membrane biosynthesis protein TonB